uniref:Uncharacterized protein n=1 Tax=Lotharella globosa TaxID=91324 RepID=A0A7S3YZ20_9EUKA
MSYDNRNGPNRNRMLSIMRGYIPLHFIRGGLFFGPNTQAAGSPVDCFPTQVVIFLAMTQHKEWKPLGLQAAAMQDFSIIDMEDDAHMIQARTEDIKASSIGITPRPSHLNRILAAPAA